MNNADIIAKIAICNGIYTEAEVADIIASGQELPLHTFQGWRDRGMIVRKGEHGIECRLWKKKSKKQAEKDKAEEENGFYLTKSYLFCKEQVEEEYSDGNINKNGFADNAITAII